MPRSPFALCHTEDAEENSRDAWFWECQNYPTCTAPTTTTPLVSLKQQTQAVNDRIPAKGCRHLLVKPWVKGTGKGNTCQLCGAIINDKGEITGTSKSIQRKLVTDERKLHSNWRRTELDLVQDEIDEAKRLLEVAHLEVQAAHSKVTEAAFRVGEAMEEMSQIKKLLEANLDQPINEDRPEEVSTGRQQKKPKTKWERWYEALKEKRNYRATRTSQHSASISVRPPRQKCMQFCSTHLPTCEEELSCTIHVFWWRLLATRKPTPLPTDTPCCHVPGPSRCIRTTTGVARHRESGGTRAS